MTSTKVVERSQAWGIARAESPHARCNAIAALTLLAPLILFGIGGVLIWGAPGLLSAVGVLLVTVLILRTSTTALVASLRPRPLEDPRARNLVDGLSADLGAPPPPAFLVEGSGRNALVFWHRGRASIGLTAEAVSSYARTELEAVITHCLCRLETGGGLSRAELRLGGIFGGCGRHPGPVDDARAAAITRYPPALAGAIRKATPSDGRFGYLWFVAEGSGAPTEARVEALSQL